MPILPLSLLFRRFLKIGATAYGGPAIAAQMKKAVVKDYGWIQEQEFMQGMALCQTLPGATWVMLSTYIGYRLRGIWGAFTSAVAFITPAFILLVILSALYFRLGNLWIVQSLFKGLGAIVVALVFHAFISFSRSIIKDWKIALISILAFFAFLSRWNIVWVLLLAGLAALLLRPKLGLSAPSSTSEAGIPLSKRKGTYFFLITLAILISLAFSLGYLINSQLAYLCLVLSKIGALAFGGGLTIVPLIQIEVVDRFRWFTTKEFLDGIAMGQVTPGPVMITSTFLGYKLGGLLGAFLGTIAIFAPAFFLISLAIPFHERLKKMGWVQTMERGILGAFIGMLGFVLYNFGRAAFVDVPSVLFAAGAFMALLRKIDLPYILLIGAVLSILLGYFT